MVGEDILMKPIDVMTRLKWVFVDGEYQFQSNGLRLAGIRKYGEHNFSWIIGVLHCHCAQGRDTHGCTVALSVAKRAVEDVLGVSHNMYVSHLQGDTK